jgi:hypothetical protein
MAWQNSDLQKQKGGGDFKKSSQSWVESRHFVDNAVAALTAGESTDSATTTTTNTTSISGDDAADAGAADADADAGAGSRAADDADADAALSAAILAEFAALEPRPFDTTGYTNETANIGRVFTCGGGGGSGESNFQLSIGFGNHGGITTLIDTAIPVAQPWASDVHPIAQPYYQVRCYIYIVSVLVECWISKIDMANVYVRVLHMSTVSNTVLCLHA